MAETKEMSPPQNRSRMMRVLRPLVVFAGLPYAIIILLLALFQRSLIYHPKHDESLNVRPDRLVTGARVEPIELTTADKLQLNGWHIVAETRGGSSDDDEVETGPVRPVILYFCGNAGTRAYRVEVFECFAEFGADAICFDYRGFGDNDGQPSEAALADDARSIWRHVTTERQIDPARIVIFGESLGGGVATRLTSELSDQGTPPAGLILRSTFTRLTDAASWHFPWVPVGLLMLDRYPSIERIGGVTCPVLIFHGRRDTIIPFEQGAELFAAASTKNPGQKSDNRFVALETADHNDVLSAERDAFRAGLQEFLKRCSTKSFEK